MKIKVQPKLKLQKGAVVMPFLEEELKEIASFCPISVKEFIEKRVKRKEFSAKKKEAIFAYLEEKKLPEKLLLFGLGGKDEFDSVKARELGAELSKVVKKNKLEEVSLFLGKFANKFLEEFLEGFLMMQYDSAKFKTKKEEDEGIDLKNMEIVVGGSKRARGECEEIVKKTVLIVDAVNYMRDLVNGPANFIDGEYLAGEAKRMCKKNGYKMAVLGEKDLKKIKAGGILAVNQGSKNEAKMIVLRYDGGKRNEKPLVFIGKGVIFDTGGYNLKPTGGIETMHQDMAGAGNVLGIFEVLKRLGVKRNVVGIVPVVSNMISDSAYRPSDIIKMLNGKTVEITNTDAEGRLILADTLSYALDLKPTAMITIATLTGAVAVALGDRYCGLLGNDKELIKKLKKAGDETDDLMWELPIHEDFRRKMKSEIADYRNYDNGTGRYAGTAKAAAFLENFVEKTPWVHMDTGGTAYTTDPKPYEYKGATAQGLRALLKFLY